MARMGRLQSSMYNASTERTPDSSGGQTVFDAADSVVLGDSRGEWCVLKAEGEQRASLRE